MVNIKSIEAQSKSQALEIAKKEYGNNFSVLGYKEINSKYFLGFLSKRKYLLRIMLKSSKM